MNNYEITVLMPVYNAEKYLREAVESILNQTYADFEFLIINDGSTDETLSILESYSTKDNRIKLLSQKKEGLISALNLGLREAKGKYIVRMDADDISLPKRIEVQFNYMENHDDIGVCGCWVQRFGEINTARIIPSDDATIRSGLIFGCTLAHPGVILKREILQKHQIEYRNYPYAEDYDLWTQLAPYTRFANIQEILLLYRIHPNQIGQTFHQQQIETTQRIRLELIRRLGVTPTKEEEYIHECISWGHYKLIQFQYIHIYSWLHKLQEANRQSHIFPEPSFSEKLAEKWTEVCVSRNDIKASIKFFSTPLRKYSKLGLTGQIKLLLRPIKWFIIGIIKKSVSRPH